MTKAMEAVSSTLKDVDEGSCSDNIYSGSLSLVGPFVAALERLRLLHEKARSGRGVVQRRSSAPSLALPRARTCETGAQTDNLPADRTPSPRSKAVSPEAVPRSGYPDEGSTPKSNAASRNSIQTRAVATKAAGVQVCRSHFVVDVGLQADFGPSSPRHSRRALQLTEASTQTACRESPVGSSHASVQTSARNVALKSSFTQTESGTANSTVRIVRMARMQRMAQQPLTQSSPALLEPKPIAAGTTEDQALVIEPDSTASAARSSTGHSAASSQSRSHGGSRDRPRGHRSRSKPQQNSANSVDGQRAAVTDAPLLRCPAGHGMQWIRSRCIEILTLVPKRGFFSAVSVPLQSQTQHPSIAAQFAFVTLVSDTWFAVPVHEACEHQSGLVKVGTGALTAQART